MRNLETDLNQLFCIRDNGLNKEPVSDRQGSRLKDIMSSFLPQLNHTSVAIKANPKDGGSASARLPYVTPPRVPQPPSRPQSSMAATRRPSVTSSRLGGRRTVTPLIVCAILLDSMGIRISILEASCLGCVSQHLFGHTAKSV